MKKVDQILEHVRSNNQGENEFLQVVEEVFKSVKPILARNEKFLANKIFERITEPERIVSFKVCWQDDNNEIQINRGYRVQMNSAIGPYKGGLRFHPSVNQSILKFLALEQTFKNALTDLPLGSGKGGADFNPKGKSDGEIMRFCQAWMMEAYRHLGHFTDIPAGDIGVGEKEIGYLFGTYKKIKNEFQGTLTGKGLDWGGSQLRSEATGYGLVYFSQHMLQEVNETLESKTCLVSGTGKVSQFTIEKLLFEKAKVIAFSDSSGCIVDEKGVDWEKLAFIKKLKNESGSSIAEYADTYKSSKFYKETNKIWSIKADCAFPCATENELDEESAEILVKNKILLIAEGANMPCTNEALEIILASKILYGPGKAANAGGVAVSGLEMCQNRLSRYWSKDEMDVNLRMIMKDIHQNCLNMIHKYKLKEDDYFNGANIYGFEKIARSMLAQGLY